MDRHHYLRPPQAPRLGWEQALEWEVEHQSPPMLMSPCGSKAWTGPLTIHVGPLLIYIHQDCINGWTQLEAEKVLGLKSPCMEDLTLHR